MGWKQSMRQVGLSRSTPCRDLLLPDVSHLLGCPQHAKEKEGLHVFASVCVSAPLITLTLSCYRFLIQIFKYHVLLVSLLVLSMQKYRRSRHIMLHWKIDVDQKISATLLALFLLSAIFVQSHDVLMRK